MTGRKSQVLEFVAFVHKKVVDSHPFEIDRIVLPFGDVVGNPGEFGLQILFPDFQPFQHSSGNFPSLLTEHFQILFHRVEFFLKNPLLYFERLGNGPELFVGQDDAIPVVVSDIAENPCPVSDGKVVFAGIENTCIGIGFAECGGNIVHIGL